MSKPAMNCPCLVFLCLALFLQCAAGFGKKKAVAHNYHFVLLAALYMIKCQQKLLQK